MPVSRTEIASRALRGMAVLLGAAMLLWPTLLNGYPFVENDDFGYVANGPKLVRILFRGAPLGGMRQWLRSEFYSLGLDLLRAPHSVWGPVVFDALVTAWVLWLLVRGLGVRRVEAVYLGMVGLLAATTGVAWWVSLLGPDMLGPAAYLSVYVLVFGERSLSRMETLGVVLLGAWAISANPTHLVVSVAVLAVFAVAWMARWCGLRQHGAGWMRAAAMIALSVVAQFAMHARLFGRPSLNGEQAPYIMARFVSDGPAKVYLQTHCPQLGWTICRYSAHLPDNEDAFLWAPDGVWMTSTPEERTELQQEEMPLVRGTLRAYPRQQMRISLGNFRAQLTTYNLFGFIRHPWLMQHLDEAIPGASGHMAQTRQTRGTLPLERWTDLQQALVLASLVLAPLLLWMAWRRRDGAGWMLAALVATVVLVNAAVCGILSGLDPRYEARVIWMLPLLVLVLASRQFLAEKDGRGVEDSHGA